MSNQIFLYKSTVGRNWNALDVYIKTPFSKNAFYVAVVDVFKGLHRGGGGTRQARLDGIKRRFNTCVKGVGYSNYKTQNMYFITVEELLEKYPDYKQLFIITPPAGLKKFVRR